MAIEFAVRALEGSLVHTDAGPQIRAIRAEDLSRARAIIDDHLARFAFREAFETMNWQPAA